MLYYCTMIRIKIRIRAKPEILMCQALSEQGRGVTYLLYRYRYHYLGIAGG